MVVDVQNPGFSWLKQQLSQVHQFFLTQLQFQLSCDLSEAAATLVQRRTLDKDWFWRFWYGKLWAWECVMNSSQNPKSRKLAATIRVLPQEMEGASYSPLLVPFKPYSISKLLIHLSLQWERYCISTSSSTLIQNLSTFLESAWASSKCPRSMTIKHWSPISETDSIREACWTASVCKSSLQDWKYT